MNRKWEVRGYAKLVMDVNTDIIEALDHHYGKNMRIVNIENVCLI